MGITEERFWTKVDRNGPAIKPELGPCWIWKGAKNSDHYGEIGRVLAHRRSWEMANGPIPDGKRVLHKCDNPPCVRPDHLFLGTMKDNTQDMLLKGRHLTVSKPGEFNPAAKLTYPQVKEIRSRFSQGERIVTLARHYGVVEGTIGFIVHNQTWLK